MTSDLATSESHAAAGGRPDGRQSRSDGAASRARILSAAGKLFASRGYSGVSTRELARAARVNLSAISYHFGGKEGLYKQVIQQLLDDTEPVVHPVAEFLTEAVEVARGDRQALSNICDAFVRGLLSSVFGDNRIGWQMALMLREFHEPSKQFATILDQRIHPMHNAVATLVGAATGRPADDEETVLLTFLIIAQCMSFGTARVVAWARMGWTDYSPERLAQVAGVLIPTILRTLGLPPATEMRGSS